MQGAAFGLCRRIQGCVSTRSKDNIVSIEEESVLAAEDHKLGCPTTHFRAAGG